MVSVVAWSCIVVGTGMMAAGVTAMTLLHKWRPAYIAGLFCVVAAGIVALLLPDGEHLPVPAFALLLIGTATFVSFLKFLFEANSNRRVGSSPK